jgi:poly(3-hydroxybutyrate) depolymerase
MKTWMRTVCPASHEAGYHRQRSGVARFGRSGTIFALLLSLATVALRADPLPKGPGKIECPNGAEPITLFTYKPPTYKDGPLLVVCHGVQRNAEDYRNYAITMAERFGAIVVAPLFDTQRFPSARYQRGGLVGADGKAQPPEAWTYAAIPKIVAHVRALENKAAAALPYYLIGHSAGGQFLVRLAAFLPGEAVRIVAANPGSHLFPTRDQEFGYGFGGLPAELASDDVMRRYLAAPMTIYLGTDDIYPRPSFDDSAAGNRQGQHRLERGRNCFEFARKLAAERGWAFNWRKVETPGIGHDAAFMFAAKEAGDALFGKK